MLLVLIASLLWGCDRHSGSDQNAEEQSPTCALRLRMIDGAKQNWAEANQKTTNDTPKMEDLSLFLRGLPTCPSGGVYTIARVGELSTCSIPGHTAYYQKSAGAN